MRGPRSVQGTALALALVATGVLFVGPHQLSNSASFLPAVLAVVAVLDVFGVLLLHAQFRAEGDPRALALSWAYSWSLVVMGGYALAFPGVVGPGPLNTWPSAAPYMWVSWHAGFPLLLGLAVCRWPSGWTRTVPAPDRGRVMGLTTAIAVTVGASFVALAATSGSWAPSVIHGLDTARMTRVCGPGMALCCGLGTWWSWRGAAAKDGPERWVPLAATAVCADVVLTLSSLHRYSVGWYAGRLLTVLAAGIVVTAMLGEVQRTRRLLGLESAMLSGLLTHADAAVAVKDLDGTYRVVNPTLADLLGQSAEALTGRTLDGFVASGASAAISDAEATVLRTGLPVCTEDRVVDPCGVERTYLTTRFLLKDREGEPFALGGIGTDVTALMLSRAELKRQAFTDGLTDLPNRSALLAELASSSDDGERALVLLDLDRFKVVNDSLGHQAGDAVIIATGERLTRVLGDRPGSMVVRLGGDEFVLLLHGEGRSDLLATAQRALEALRAPLSDPALGRRRLVMTSSAGLTWVAPGAVDPSQALREADLALYASKERGRNCLSVFDDGLRAAAEQRLAAEQQVRSALSEDRLRVHLQPFTHLATGEVVGAEALLRVVQPDGSERLTEGFIEVAGEIGLLVDVDAFVLRTAADWLRERASGGGPDLLHASGFERLSVNVSAGTLRSAWFGEVLEEVLTALPEGGPRLALEITESTLLEADLTVSRMLERVRLSGADLGLDDFGTGYSSLAQLQRVPVDFVKLDRSFTSALDDGDGVNARAMVRAVLDLTRALGLDVVAEGVETAAQRDALVGIGFTTGQGWLFSRAEPPRWSLLPGLVPAPRASPADVPVAS